MPGRTKSSKGHFAFCVVFQRRALLQGEVILPLPGDFTKRSVAASWGFSDSFYLDVTIRRFSGGVFWISDLLARVCWSSEINGPAAATSQRSK